MFVEEKMYKSNVAKWFKNLLAEIINPALKEYCPNHEVDYRGYHLVQFENESPKDGKIYLDYREVTPKELRDFLSME